MQGIVQAGAAGKINSAVCADNEFSLSALFAFNFFGQGVFESRKLYRTKSSLLLNILTIQIYKFCTSSARGRVKPGELFLPNLVIATANPAINQTFRAVGGNQYPPSIRAETKYTIKPVVSPSSKFLHGGGWI